jgi:hypothetical protein
MSRRPLERALALALALALVRLAAVVTIVAALFMAAAGCSPRPPNATPEGAVRELVDRLRRVQGDPNDAKGVFVLLSKRAQANLAARAQRYSAASGKAITPEAMIVPSRFLLRFEPQSYTAQVAGQHALVNVVGLMPNERAQIPCVFEDNAWRVDLLLPPLPPVQMRPGTPG